MPYAGAAEAAVGVVAAPPAPAAAPRKGMTTTGRREWCVTYDEHDPRKNSCSRPLACDAMTSATAPSWSAFLTCFLGYGYGGWGGGGVDFVVR
jgi:hypothetical protein